MSFTSPPACVRRYMLGAVTGAPCRDCGHTNLVHGGGHNPDLTACVICQLVMAAQPHPEPPKGDGGVGAAYYPGAQPSEDLTEHLTSRLNEALERGVQLTEELNEARTGHDKLVCDLAGARADNEKLRSKLDLMYRAHASLLQTMVDMVTKGLA